MQGNWKERAGEIAKKNITGSYGECAKFVRQAIQEARG
jgi:hypothetical protein